MPDKIIHIRSLTPGSVPTTSSLGVGEIAINVPDGKAFLRQSGSTDTIQSFVTTNSTTTGSVTISGSITLTGSLNITGSTTQIGNNTLLGNTTLSGSIIISGSTITPTVQVYGNITHDGYVRFNPVTTNIDTSISASYIYVSGSTSDLYFSQNGEGYSNTTRLRWLEGNLYTGLLSGGIISASLGTNTYYITSGSGIIVNLNASTSSRDPYPTVQYLQWNTLSHTIDGLSGSADQQFVAIDNTATIVAQANPYVDGDFNTKIPIGVVIHQNRSSINAYQTFPSLAYGWKQRTTDFVKAFGPLKISGYTLEPSGSSTGSLKLSSGTAWVDGRNYTVDPNNPSYISEATGITTSKIYRYYQSGSSWVYDTNNGVGFETIDPTKYSNNGVLTTVSTTNWTIQRVFYFPNSATKAFYVYYGNAEYANEAAALAAVGTEPFTEAPNTAANAIYVGYMLLRRNANFTNDTTYTIYQAGLFRGSGVSAAGGSGTTSPGGSDTQIQYNNAGVFGGVPTLIWDGSLLSATGSFTGSFIGNLTGTASYALTSSFVTASNVYGPYGSNSVISASYANTAVTASISDRTTQTDILVLNQTGNTINKGLVVRITGSNNASDIPRIVTASYENDNNSANTLGITAENISNGSTGYVITEGVLTGINTTAFISGQLIYLGATGSITGSAPRAPLHAVRLGEVVREQSNNGSIYVRIDNGYELGELHDVVDDTTTGSYGDLLIKSGSVWTNSKNLTGSYTLSGSLSTNDGITAITINATSVTASLFGTSSWANQAVTASYVTASNVYGPFGSNSILSSSYALTASYALTSAGGGSGAGFPFTGSAVITGSLIVTGSATFTDSIVIDATLITASLVNTGAGNTTISTQATGSYRAMFAKYTIFNSGNARAGEFMAAWNGTNIQFTDTSTTDIGNTSTVVLTGSLTTTDVQLSTGVGVGWTVKTQTTYI